MAMNIRFSKQEIVTGLTFRLISSVLDEIYRLHRIFYIHSSITMGFVTQSSGATKQTSPLPLTLVVLWKKLFA